MASAMRKIGEYLGLVEDTGAYDQRDQYDGADEYDTEAVQTTRGGRFDVEERPRRESRTPAPVSDLADRRPRRVPSPGVVELSRILSAHPRP